VDEAPAVRALWAQLDLPGAIDIHTHFMPANVMAKVWRYFDTNGAPTGRPWPITYRMDEQARLHRLREFGILAFTALLYPHKPDMAAWLNAWARDFARRTPDCLHTATFYPEPAAADYVPTAIEAGARIFKAHLQVGGYDPNDPLLEAVWGAIEDARLPVVTHAGSGPTPGAFTGPAPIARLLAHHPRLRLVIAHMGMPEYAEFLDLAERHPNLHLDTTMAFTDFTEQIAPFPPGELPRLRQLQDRILLGTDFPNIPYRYCDAVTALIDLDLGTDWLRDVLFHNATRLLSI
jgi:predicted TIM-barrel fold metal-dependent hydrolase